MSDQQQIKKQYEACIKLLQMNETSELMIKNGNAREYSIGTIQAVKDFIKDWEKRMEFQNSYHFCPNHLLEVYLYDYYINREDCHVIEYHIHELYRIIAADYAKKGQEQLAMEAYYKAISYNEVDLDSLFAFATFLYDLGKLDEFHQQVLKAFPYCYTRSDLARYYRLLGRFYVDRYQPEVAEALYEYSNLFYESQLVESELKFIEAALKRERKNLSVTQLQEILSQKEIPVQPNQETLAMLYQLGKQQLSEGNLDYANFLLLCLYQLTGDEEVKNTLELIEKHMHSI